MILFPRMLTADIYSVLSPSIWPFWARSKFSFLGVNKFLYYCLRTYSNHYAHRASFRNDTAECENSKSLSIESGALKP